MKETKIDPVIENPNQTNPQVQNPNLNSDISIIYAITRIAIKVEVKYLEREKSRETIVVWSS